MLIIFSLLTLTRAERVDGGMHSRICLKFSAKKSPTVLYTSHLKVRSYDRNFSGIFVIFFY